MGYVIAGVSGFLLGVLFGMIITAALVAASNDDEAEGRK